MKKLKICIFTAMLTAVLLTGCAGTDSSSQNSASAPRSGASVSQSAANFAPGSSESGAPGEKISEAQAKSAALAHAGVAESDVQAIRAESDYDDGRRIYDVEFWCKTDSGSMEYDYEIDAFTGEIVYFDQDAEYYTYVRSDTPPRGTELTARQAETAALDFAAAHSGINKDDVKYLRTEFEMDDGRTYYKVSWRIGYVEYECEVDAVTGEVFAFESDAD